MSNAQLQSGDFFFTGQASLYIFGGFDYGALYTDLVGIDLALTSHDATRYVVVNPSAELIISLISNSGFTYDGSGNPTGGSVNSFAVYDPLYHQLTGARGVNFSLTSLLTGNQFA